MTHEPASQPKRLTRSEDRWIGDGALPVVGTVLAG